MNTHPNNTNSTQSLSEAWLNLISRYDWDWYVTHTFREDVYPERADKLWRVWCSKINTALYGNHWHKKVKRGTVPGVYWVRAIEYQKRGVLHFHGLVKGVQGMNQFIWMNEWLNLDGKGLTEGLTGMSRIHPYENFNKQNYIIQYISKYVSKGGEIDLSPNLINYQPELFRRN